MKIESVIGSEREKCLGLLRWKRESKSILEWRDDARRPERV